MHANFKGSLLNATLVVLGWLAYSPGFALAGLLALALFGRRAK